MSRKSTKNANFFSKESKNTGEFFKVIEIACKGLNYISETDAPVLPFAGEPADTVTSNIILRQLGRPAGEPVEEIEFDEFFGRLTLIREWYGEPERQMAEKFLELQRLLEEFLNQRKVFRIGRIQVDIFAVGLDRDGRLMGVSTYAVET